MAGDLTRRAALLGTGAATLGLTAYGPSDLAARQEQALDDPGGAGVAGRLLHRRSIASAHLEETRHVSIWLPPEYDAEPDARFSVLYMHDGQNLFDPRLANFAVDWGVDEALMRLTAAGAITPRIVVGAWSTPQRWREYAPAGVIAQLPADTQTALADEGGGPPVSDAYVRFLADELKPAIDAELRTKTKPADTAVMGSSMGGLISLYALCERPDVFGRAGCLSTHWPLSVDRARIADRADAWRPQALAAFEAYLSNALPDPTGRRLWIDHGDVNLDSLYPPYQAALLPTFAAKGYVEAPSFAARAYPGTDHNEAAWRDRVDDPLTFLLA